MMLQNSHRSVSKKLMITLALSIGLMPVQEIFAAPKKVRTQTRLNSNKTKQAADEQKVNEHAASQNNTDEETLQFFELWYLTIYYGPGAHGAAAQLREQYKQLNFKHLQVVSFEGPDAKEKAIKLRDEVEQGQRIGAIIVFSTIIGLAAICFVPAIAIAIDEWSRNRHEIQNDGARLIPIVEGIHEGAFPNQVNFAWNDRALLRELVNNTDRGAALRNVVTQNARFYGTETLDHFHRARERIDNFRFLTMMRGMHADVYAQSLIENFPDDIEVVGFHHLRNNAFNRIRQMPQAVRNLLVDAMTNRHLDALRTMYQRAHLNNFGLHVFNPELPDRQAVQQIMQQRMNAIMAQAQNQ